MSYQSNHPLRPFGKYVSTPEFRRLVHQLQSIQEQRNIFSISILSRFAGEGRTFFSAAVAVAYASLLGKRVLVLDTVHEPARGKIPLRSMLSYTAFDRDIRPEMARPSNNPGSIHLLTVEQIREQTYFHLHPTSPTDQNLPSVHATHTETGGGSGTNGIQFGSASVEFSLKDMLLALRPSYDLVLADTLPLDGGREVGFDPIVVATQVEGAVLLTSPQSLDSELMASTKREFQRLKVPIIATAHNTWVNQVALTSARRRSK